MIRGPLALLLALLLVGCGVDGFEGASGPSPKSSSTPSDPPSSSTPDDIIAVPLAPERLPADFTGSDAEYVDHVHEELDRRDVTVELSDQSLIMKGREFCWILSGGGMLADKVDFWAGSIRLPLDHDLPIFVAAWDVYCPDLASGYKRIRTSEPVEPTAVQRADLARFMATLHQPTTAEVDALSVRDLRRMAGPVCRKLGSGQFAVSDINRFAGFLPPLGRGQFVLALVANYCFERFEDLKAAMSSLA